MKLDFPVLVSSFLFVLPKCFMKESKKKAHERTGRESKSDDFCERCRCAETEKASSSRSCGHRAELNFSESYNRTTAQFAAPKTTKK